MTNKTMPEVHYDVVEFDCMYEITTHGRIFSKKLNRFLTPNPDHKGYLQVCISHKNKNYSRKIHRLMAKNILGIKSNQVLNHKDGDVSNNRIENLECVSQRENVAHGNACKKYVGVTFLKRVNKWQSRILIDGKRLFLGNFDNPEDAQNAYKLALIEFNQENKYV